MASFGKIFSPQPGAQPGQFFTGSETPEVRGLRAERDVKRDASPSEGAPEVPEEPLDTAEFVMTPFPFKSPSSSGDAAPPPIQTTPPLTLLPSPPPIQPTPLKATQTSRPVADWIYRRNLMALAVTISNQMAQNVITSPRNAA